MRFSDALDRKLEEVKRPPNLPVGHYVWQIMKHPEVEQFEGRDGGSFDRVTFIIGCVEAKDDVDSDELAEYGNVQGAQNRKTFLFSNNEDDKANFERSMFNMKRFLEHAGVDQSLSLSEALAASVGGQFIGELTHRPDPKDPEVIYSEVGKTAPL